MRKGPRVEPMGAPLRIAGMGVLQMAMPAKGISTPASKDGSLGTPGISTPASKDRSLGTPGFMPQPPRGRQRTAGSPGGTLLPTSDAAYATAHRTAHQTAHQTTRQEAILQRTPDQQAEQDALNRMVRQCIAGDQHAWQQLVAAQHRRIYGICYRFTGSAADAEDLTQDVFLKLYRNLASFDTQKGNFQTWLTTLARNLLVDHFRRTRLERATDSLDASLSAEDGGLSLAGRLADSRPSQEAHAAGLELKVLIQQALAQQIGRAHV